MIARNPVPHPTSSTRCGAGPASGESSKRHARRWSSLVRPWSSTSSNTSARRVPMCADDLPLRALRAPASPTAPPRPRLSPSRRVLTLIPHLSHLPPSLAVPARRRSSSVPDPDGAGNTAGQIVAAGRAERAPRTRTASHSTTSCSRSRRRHAHSPYSAVLTIA